MSRRVIVFIICFCFIFEQTGFAQVVPAMGIPAYLNNYVPVADKFRPVHLRALSLDPNQNDFNLLLDKGDAKNIKTQQLEETSKKLLEYFQIGVALPNDVFWVNLRPDSPNDTIDPSLENTDLGRILLEADLELKKDMARFTSPDTPEGKKYWDSLYVKAEEIYGPVDMTIPALMRPWIVPGEIVVGESKEGAYIYKATLKVMLEQDYLAGSIQYRFDDVRAKALNDYSAELIRALIVPKLTVCINSSRKYSALRQVYYSLILAQWFKSRSGDQFKTLAGKINSRVLSGLTSKTPWSKSTYFNAYKKSFENGEYKREDTVSTQSGITIRSYYSGGLVFKTLKSLTNASSLMRAFPGGAADYLIKLRVGNNGAGDLSRRDDKITVRQDGGIDYRQYWSSVEEIKNSAGTGNILTAVNKFWTDADSAALAVIQFRNHPEYGKEFLSHQAQWARYANELKGSIDESLWPGFVVEALTARLWKIRGQFNEAAEIYNGIKGEASSKHIERLLPVSPSSDAEISSDAQVSQKVVDMLDEFEAFLTLCKDSGTVSVRLSPDEITVKKDVLDAVLMNFDEDLRKRVQIHTDGVRMKTYEFLLREVFLNLLNNGFKYANPEIDDQFIKIDISERDGKIIIRYKDNGLGMNEETGKYFLTGNGRPPAIDISEDSTRHRGGDGTKIVLRYLKILGGDAFSEFSSVPGNGTEFTIVIDQNIEKDYIVDLASLYSTVKHDIDQFTTPAIGGISLLLMSTDKMNKETVEHFADHMEKIRIEFLEISGLIPRQSSVDQPQNDLGGVKQDGGRIIFAADANPRAQQHVRDTYESLSREQMRVLRNAILRSDVDLTDGVIRIWLQGDLSRSGITEIPEKRPFADIYLDTKELCLFFPGAEQHKDYWQQFDVKLRFDQGFSLENISLNDGTKLTTFLKRAANEYAVDMRLSQINAARSIENAAQFAELEVSGRVTNNNAIAIDPVEANVTIKGSLHWADGLGFGLSTRRPEVASKGLWHRHPNLQQLGLLLSPGDIIYMYNEYSSGRELKPETIFVPNGMEILARTYVLKSWDRSFMASLSRAAYSLINAEKKAQRILGSKREELIHEYFYSCTFTVREDGGKMRDGGETVRYSSADLKNYLANTISDISWTNVKETFMRLSEGADEKPTIKLLRSVNDEVRGIEKTFRIDLTKIYFSDQDVIMLEELAARIYELKIIAEEQRPIVVWEVPSGERFIADGHTRTAALLKLLSSGSEPIFYPAYVLKVDKLGIPKFTNSGIKRRTVDDIRVQLDNGSRVSLDALNVLYSEAGVTFEIKDGGKGFLRKLMGVPQETVLISPEHRAEVNEVCTSANLTVRSIEREDVREFPNLKIRILIEDSFPDSNCVGATLGLNESITPVDYDRFYYNQGYTPVSSDADPNDIINADIVVFANSRGEKTHAARRLKPGSKWWISKMGAKKAMIVHELSWIEGGAYGNVFRYYAKTHDPIAINIAGEDRGEMRDGGQTRLSDFFDLGVTEGGLRGWIRHEVPNPKIVEIDIAETNDEKTFAKIQDAIKNKQACEFNFKGLLRKFKTNHERYMYIRDVFAYLEKDRETGEEKFGSGQGYPIIELLKNAFKHGSKLNFEYPIYLYLELDSYGKMQKIVTYDCAVPGEIDPLKEQQATTEFGGQGKGLIEMEKYGWQSTREKLNVRNPRGGRDLIGTQVTAERVPFSKDGGIDKGGVDFRALPIVNQPAVNPSIAIANIPPLADIKEIGELNNQWREIEKQMQAEAMPYTKIKEYVTVCKNKNAVPQLDNVVACMANILRLEEERALPTAQEVKDILISIG